MTIMGLGEIAPKISAAGAVTLRIILLGVGDF